MKLELFEKGDVYIDDDYQDCKFHWDKATKKVYAKPYKQAFEVEIPKERSSFRDAMSTGKAITKEEYWSDSPDGEPKPEAPEDSESI